ncbi:hypothetical protein YC2023_098577 [Brassica napus]
MPFSGHSSSDPMTTPGSSASTKIVQKRYPDGLQNGGTALHLQDMPYSLVREFRVKWEKKKEGSYRYWVREATADAAPPPQPRKLTNNDVVASNAPALGSLWNQAGTWEMVQFIK